jgi:flagellar basal body-associated protein FliL
MDHNQDQAGYYRKKRCLMIYIVIAIVSLLFCAMSLMSLNSDDNS